MGPEVDDEEVSAIEDNKSNTNFENDINHGNHDVNKKKQKKKVDKGTLFKPLSNDELHQLKDAESLFHSSVFQLQIKELLNEVRLKEKRIEKIKNSVKRLKNILLTLPIGEESDDYQQLFDLLEVVKNPLMPHGRCIKGKFKFLPPKDVKTIGSFRTGTCLKPNPSVDILITMPKECFQSKDNLNHRYSHKRSQYISVLAKRLQMSKDVDQIRFSYHLGNRLQPIIKFIFKGSSELENKETSMHIHVCPEEGSFKYNRFHVQKNNIRTSWFFGDIEEHSEEPATPHYNNTILQDMTMEYNNQFVQTMLHDLPAVKEGILLLKVWLKQRELDQGYGAFSGFIMSMYVIFLLINKKLNKMMSNYQIMRNTLLHLSKEDWTTDGCNLCDDQADLNRPTIEEFHRRYECVFVDKTGYMNVCSDLTRSTFSRVKHEAELAVKFLEDNKLDGFSQLFMTPVPFTRKFDQILHIDDDAQLRAAVDKLHLKDRLSDFGGDYVQTVIPELLNLLQKGLSKRIYLLQIKQCAIQEWPMDSYPPGLEGRLTIGLLLNPEFAFSSVDRGPPADSPEAKEFRAFWGQKSELRRFKDSSIVEAVPWTNEKAINKKRMICCLVVREVLKRWAGLSHISFIGDQLDQILSVPVKSKNKQFVNGTGEEQHIAFLQSFDNLSKLIRNLKDLPLNINSIQGVSPIFRFTEVIPVMPATFFSYSEISSDITDHRLLPVHNKPCPLFTASSTVVCLLEGSGQWPDDKDAFHRLKAALHIKLGEVLHDQHKLPVAIQTDHVNIRFENFVFRLELQYLREIALLKKVTTQDGMVKFVDNDLALALEKKSKLLPVLTSTMHGLAKRWIAAQLLSDFVPDIAIELLVAFLYTNHAPYTVPSIPLTGFLRFLHLVSTFDWNTSPLIVNLNSELTVEDYSHISSHFTKFRTNMPAMFISTPQDHVKSIWTVKQPTSMILNRFVLLATECLQVLEAQIMKQSILEVDFKKIFRPSLKDFHIIIHLNRKQLACEIAMIDRPAKYQPVLENNQEKEYKSCLPVFDFDPAEKYLHDLKEIHEGKVLFFYDKYGGQVIGVLIKPQSFKEKEITLNNMCGSKPESINKEGTNVGMKFNLNALIEDLKILGDGLVTSIQILKEYNCDVNNK